MGSTKRASLAATPTFREPVFVFLSATAMPDSGLFRIGGCPFTKCRNQFGSLIEVRIIHDPYGRASVLGNGDLAPDAIKEFPANLGLDICSFQ